MRIGVAQTRPFKGDILRNIEAHLRLIELARNARADMIVFPELSITGYEPELAASLATTGWRYPAGCLSNVKRPVFHDHRGGDTDDGWGRGTDHGADLSARAAAASLFQAILTSDEEPYFVCGAEAGFLGDGKIALAICYELSVPAHSEEAYRGGADVYLVSVAKTKYGDGAGGGDAGGYREEVFNDGIGFELCRSQF